MSRATPDRIRRLHEALGTKAKPAPTSRCSLLDDQGYRADMLGHAYALAKPRDGAPGVDGETFEASEAAGRERWVAAVQAALRTETARPPPVRRVRIPKPGGGERPLGIPTIRERVVQTAVRLIRPPIVAADRDPTADGYRPGRTAHAAITVVHRVLCAGHTPGVDADGSPSVDTIPPAALRQALARRLSDRTVLRWLTRWLKTPVAERTTRGGWRDTGGQRATRGIPQGGGSSPLLANGYMHRSLQAFRQAGLERRDGARRVNDADDVVGWCRQGAAEILAQTRPWVQPMGLTLNEPQTRRCHGRREAVTCLGDTCGPQYDRKDGHWSLGAAPAKKAVQRIKGRIRQILCPANPAPWEQVRTELNTMIRGGAASCSYGTRLMAYRAVDRYVAERVRSCLRRRHKIPTRGTRRFSTEVLVGEWGVVRLRRVHLASAAQASV